MNYDPTNPTHDVKLAASYRQAHPVQDNPYSDNHCYPQPPSEPFTDFNTHHGRSSELQTNRTSGDDGAYQERWSYDNQFQRENRDLSNPCRNNSNSRRDGNRDNSNSRRDGNRDDSNSRRELRHNDRESSTRRDRSLSPGERRYIDSPSDDERKRSGRHYNDFHERKSNERKSNERKSNEHRHYRSGRLSMDTPWDSPRYKNSPKVQKSQRQRKRRDSTDSRRSTDSSSHRYNVRRMRKPTKRSPSSTSSYTSVDAKATDLGQKIVPKKVPVETKEVVSMATSASQLLQDSTPDLTKTSAVPSGFSLTQVEPPTVGQPIPPQSDSRDTLTVTATLRIDADALTGKLIPRLFSEDLDVKFSKFGRDGEL